MSFIRSSEDYKELRQSRIDASLVEVAAILLDRSRTDAAIKMSGVFTGVKGRNINDWIAFLFNDMVPEKNLPGNKNRIPTYLQDILQNIKDQQGYTNDVLESNELSDKQREAILLYAVCYEVESNYMMLHTKEKQILMRFNDLYREQNNTAMQDEIKKILGLIEKSHDVLKGGYGIKEKFPTLAILLDKIMREYQGQLQGQQIPKQLQLEIVKTINDQVNEIKSWKAGGVTQMLFGGWVDSKIALKKQKIDFLHRVLAAPNLLEAKKIIVKMDNQHPEVIDGRTMTLADEILSSKGAKFAPVVVQGPAKLRQPKEPDTTQISPKTPRGD